MMKLVFDNLPSERGKIIPPSQRIYVDAFPLLGKSVAVQTDHLSIINIVDHVRNFADEGGRNSLSVMYRMLYGSLITVRENDLANRVLSQDRAARDEWKNFCSDVVILYAIRYVVHNRPIPMNFVSGIGVNGIGVDVD